MKNLSYTFTTIIGMALLVLCLVGFYNTGLDSREWLLLASGILGGLLLSLGVSGLVKKT